jgi:hypothetical protein
MSPREYRIVSGSLPKVQSEVQEYLDGGWSLEGNLSVIAFKLGSDFRAELIYTQVVVR